MVPTATLLTLVAACAGVLPDFPTHREIELSHKAMEVAKRADAGDIKDNWEEYVDGGLTGSEKRERSVGGLHLVPWYADASSYCKDLQNQARDSYTLFRGAGIPLAVIGVGGTAFAGAFSISNATKKDASPSETAALAAVTAGSALVAVLGVYLLGRSSGAATASGNAGLALLQNDESTAWKACAQVRADWLGANAAAAQKLADMATNSTAKDAGADASASSAGTDGGTAVAVDGGDGGL